MGRHFRRQAVEIRKGENRSVTSLTNAFSNADGKPSVPDFNVEDSERPPHDGEYVGTIEVVVLRCHPSDKRPVIGNQTSSDESSDDDEMSTPGRFDGASDHQPEPTPKPKSRSRAQIFGLDGTWDNWGPPPPPVDEPNNIQMTSENTGTWNPVGQESKNSKALEKTTRWAKRSESRDHFQSDFQKRGSPAGSERGRFGQHRSSTDQENAPPLKIRGGGPGSYSVASSEAMRNWNRGPGALKEWTQGDAPSKGSGEPPAAFDPWTGNLPMGDFTNEDETKLRAQVGAWGTPNETTNMPGSKKGSKKGSVVSGNPAPIPGAWGESNDQDLGKKDDWGDDWGDTNDQNPGNGGDDWGGAGNGNAQDNDDWNAGGDQSRNENDDWNNNGGASGWDAPNDDEKKDDGAWDPPHHTSNGNTNDWKGNENSNAKKNDDWGAIADNDTKQNGGWEATAGNDAQLGNSWGGDNGQQTDDWGGDDTKQVTAGAEDTEKDNKPTSNQQAASGEKAGSTLSFGNSRAKGPKPASKAGSKSKPALVGTKAVSSASNKKPRTFDWLKPSLEKVSNASGPPAAVKKASMPGTWAPPVTSPHQEEPKPVSAQVQPIFSITKPPKPKPYWSKWRNPNAIAEADMEAEQASHSPEELEEEEPIYSIPAEIAQRNMMSHQVRPGRPAAYTHKRNKPKYMDTHEKPYAVFLFKYRDRSIISRMLKIPTITEPVVDEKARLASLSKQELIDELVKTKSKLSMVESDSSAGQATFVKKLDEKLRTFETGKEDVVPAVGDWVNTTSPTHGQGLGNAGEWGNGDSGKGNGGLDSGNGNGNGNETNKTNGGDWSGNGNKHDTTNVNGGGESWNGNGDNNANEKSDWDNNGNVEVSNGAEENGNAGDDWGTTDHANGAGKKDDHGWGGGNDNDEGGGGDWSKNDNTGETNVGDDWGNGNRDAKAGDDWGDDNEGSGDKGGDSWDNGGGGGGGDGGWGGNDEKKDEGHGNGNGNGDTGGDAAWGADTGGGGGGGGGGW